MPDFKFSIAMSCKGYGYVEADDLAVAKRLIEAEDWDDLYDMGNFKYIKLLEIEEEYILNFN